MSTTDDTATTERLSTLALMDIGISHESRWEYFESLGPEAIHAAYIKVNDITAEGRLTLDIMFRERGAGGNMTRQQSDLRHDLADPIKFLEFKKEGRLVRIK